MNELIPASKLRLICNKKQWFTGGDIKQYNKLFEMNAMAGACLKDLAVIIWLCSSKCTLEEVWQELKAAYAEE